jgi:hypothetical protein
MINIRQAQDVEVDYGEVIQHSAAANVPEAQEYMKSFLRKSAHTYVGFIDGKVAAVYGLLTPTLLSDMGYMWLLTTDVVDGHKFVFVRHSQVVVGSVLKHYARIVGNTSPADTRAIRWLKWLGATYKYPPDAKLLPFTITRESYEKRYG